MAALPVSPETVYNVARFAYDLWQKCKAAKGQYEKVGKGVFAMKTAVQLVAVDLENPQSLVNKLDKDSKQETHHKSLGILIQNCRRALKDVEASLKKHEEMGVVEKLRWALSGEEEANNLMADLSSSATQLDSYVSGLTMKGVGKLLGGMGRLEQLLDKNGGDGHAAVEKMMSDMRTTGILEHDAEKYKQVIANYAQEACKTVKASKGKGSKSKKDEPRERRESGATLLVPGAGQHKRARSTDTVKTAKSAASTDTKRSHSAQPLGRKKETHTLECWLIQIKSGNALFLTWQKSEKELQPRGQCQLEEMAKQFRASKASKFKDEHNLVGWVVEDRQKSEKDADHVWKPYAAKLEHKGDLLLDLGVEEQAMVIIERGLTPQAQLKADAEERAAQAKRDAAKKMAKAEAAEKKKQTKADAARRKSVEAALEKAEKERKEKAARQAEIKHLQQQVGRLRLNQQPTLADKPEAIAEKRRNEKKAREKAERDKQIEKEERAQNLAKVASVLSPDIKAKEMKAKKEKSPSPRPKGEKEQKRKGSNAGDSKVEDK